MNLGLTPKFPKGAVWIQERKFFLGKVKQSNVKWQPTNICVDKNIGSNQFLFLQTETMPYFWAMQSFLSVPFPGIVSFPNLIFLASNPIILGYFCRVSPLRYLDLSRELFQDRLTSYRCCSARARNYLLQINRHGRVCSQNVNGLLRTNDFHPQIWFGPRGLQKHVSLPHQWHVESTALDLTCDLDLALVCIVLTETRSNTKRKCKPIKR